MIPIIALTGHDGSGKSTLARAIQAEVGGTIMPFAEVIRKDLIGVGFSEDAVRAKPTPDHIRALMRAYGKACRTEHGADYFIYRWKRAVSEFAMENAGPILVDDLRYVNELLALDFQGAFFISIESQGSEPDPRQLHPEIVEQVWAVRARLHALNMGQTDVSKDNPSRYQLRRRHDKESLDGLYNLVHALGCYLQARPVGPPMYDNLEAAIAEHGGEVTDLNAPRADDDGPPLEALNLYTPLDAFLSIESPRVPSNPWLTLKRPPVTSPVHERAELTPRRIYVPKAGNWAPSGATVSKYGAESDTLVARIQSQLLQKDWQNFFVTPEEKRLLDQRWDDDRLTRENTPPMAGDTATGMRFKHMGEIHETRFVVNPPEVIRMAQSEALSQRGDFSKSP